MGGRGGREGGWVGVRKLVRERRRAEEQGLEILVSGLWVRV